MIFHFFYSFAGGNGCVIIIKGLLNGIHLIGIHYGTHHRLR